MVRKIVKSTLHAEIEDKYYDIQQGLVTVASAGVSVGKLLNGMQVGPVGGQRIGREFLNKRIQVQGYFERGTALGFNTQLLHIALVWDREPNGLGITYATVFRNASLGSSPLCFRNIDEKDRFVVLKQHKIVVPNTYPYALPNPAQNDACVQKPQNFYFSFSARLNKKTLLTQSGNAGTVADMNKGALWIVYSAQVKDTATNDTHNITYETRLTYEDS